MKNNLLFSGLIFSIFSCGPSAEEIKKREHFIADSTQAAIERENTIQDSIEFEEQQIKEYEEELAEQQRVHEEKIEVGKSVKRKTLNDYIKEITSKLAQEKRILNQISEFQIGRSSSTKRQQQSEQHEVIRQLDYFREGLKDEISHTHLHQSYDFQNSPQGTVKHLFKSAETGDYSKLRYLVDPYGEFDQEAFVLCLVEMYPSDMKERWKNEFGNSRIMGTPKIEGQTAEVEIAMGISSDKIETINLILRKDKWYIKTF